MTPSEKTFLQSLDGVDFVGDTIEVLVSIVGGKIPRSEEHLRAREILDKSCNEIKRIHSGMYVVYKLK